MSQANTSVCKPQSKVIAQILSKWLEETSKLGGKAGAIATIAKDQLPAVIARMNTFARNSWMTIGPRQIEFGNVQTGTLIIPSDRTFISAHPLEVDRASVRVVKKDGRGGATVTICKIDDQGRYSLLKQIRFEPGADPRTEQVAVTGLEGHLLQVLLDGQGGGPGSRFAYDLRVDKA